MSCLVPHSTEPLKVGKAAKVPLHHTQQFTPRNCLALLILCLSIHALQRLTFPASDFLLFSMLFAQCVTNYSSFLRGLERKVNFMDGEEERRGIVLHWASALLSLEVTCGISAPALAISH